MPVDSVQFFSTTIPLGGPYPPNYTVPTGFLAVVTDAAIAIGNSGRQLGQVGLLGDGVLFALLTFDSAESPTAQWHGRFALAAALDLAVSVNTQTDPLDITVSGYLYS